MITINVDAILKHASLLNLIILACVSAIVAYIVAKKGVKLRHLMKAVEFIKELKKSDRILLHFSAAIIAGNQELPCGYMLIRDDVNKWFPFALMYACHDSLRAANSNGASPWLVSSGALFESVSDKIKSLSNDSCDVGNSSSKGTKITNLVNNSAFKDPDWMPLQTGSNNVPTPEQAKIIDDIYVLYMNNAVAKETSLKYMVSGEAGCGKSTLCEFLAKKYFRDCKIVRGFNPTKPGYIFSKLYDDYKPTPEAPLIIDLSEFDRMVDKFHHGKILEDTGYYRTLITDKQGWCDFFDFKWPYVIFVMSTNKTPEWFFALDDAYIRKGRIDKYHLMASPPPAESSSSLSSSSLSSASSTRSSNSSSRRRISKSSSPPASSTRRIWEM